MSERAEESRGAVAMEKALASAAMALPAGLKVSRQSHLGRLTLRGREAARMAACGALGVDIPRVPCRASQSRDGTISALWLGPDEWLVLSTRPEARRLHDVLHAALTGIPHALIDVSDRQIGLEVAGPIAAEVIGAGCPLDLDRERFAQGTCARTLFHKCEIVLWRQSVDAYHLEIARSYESYFIGHLERAARSIAPPM